MMTMMMLVVVVVVVMMVMMITTTNAITITPLTVNVSSCRKFPRGAMQVSCLTAFSNPAKEKVEVFFKKVMVAWRKERVGSRS